MPLPFPLGYGWGGSDNKACLASFPGSNTGSAIFYQGSVVQPKLRPLMPWFSHLHTGHSNGITSSVELG